MKTHSGPYNPQPALYRHDFKPVSRTDLQGSIPEKFEQQVRLHPDRLALRAGGVALSYRGLNELSNRIAHAILAECGDGEEPVALLLGQSAMLPAAILGALKAGKIYVALDASAPGEERARIVADCEPGLIVTDVEHQRGRAGAFLARHRWMTLEKIDPGMPGADPRIDLDPERTACIFYTSGSTGRPKGVADTHRNVLHNVMRYTHNLGINDRDRLSLVQASSFSGTVSSLFSALLNGAVLFPFDLQRRGIARMANWLLREEITIFHSVPAVFEQLLGVSQVFPSLRIIRLEGDQTHKRQVGLFKKQFDGRCVLVNGLGATETGIIRQFFMDTRTEVSSEVVPVGGPTDDMEVCLLDPNDSPVPPGGVGEITVRSRYLAQGYWRRPDLTAAAFGPDTEDAKSRAYRTGDLGRLLFGGCLEWLGRKDFQAKIRGLRVEVALIENTLDELPEIEQALVLAREDRPGVQQLVAYLVSAVTPPPTVSRLRQELAMRLPRPMIPARYVFLHQLPADGNHKVRRRGLPPPGRTRPALEQPPVEPRDATERIIAACFCEVLELDTVGVSDDFFDLGGDSLLATQLLRLIEERLGKPCPQHFFLEGPNVADIRGRFDEQAKAGPLVRIRREGSRPPLFCLHGVSGHVLAYYRLARLLGPDQPVFGLQNAGMINGKSRLGRVESMAAAYVSAIETAQPGGPYYLCGDCFGGTLAFEVAQQLVSRGREVALLALIDTAYPGGALRRLPARIADPHHWQRLKRLPLRDALSYLTGKLRGLERWAPEVRYRPKPYPGRLILICAGPPDNQLGWKRVAGEGLTIVRLRHENTPNGTAHLTSEPYVQALARALREQIDLLSENTAPRMR